jgi:hypothetical protein
LEASVDSVVTSSEKVTRVTGSASIAEFSEPEFEPEPVRRRRHQQCDFVLVMHVRRETLRCSVRIRIHDSKKERKFLRGCCWRRRAPANDVGTPRALFQSSRGERIICKEIKLWLLRPSNQRTKSPLVRLWRTRGFAEIRIPQNELGSSIMPGKLNPTQCEALTIVAVDVFGYDPSLTFAGSQVNFKLNTHKPVVLFKFCNRSKSWLRACARSTSVVLRESTRTTSGFVSIWTIH